MRLVQVTPPTVEPLLPGDVRARLNIGSEVSDDVLTAFVAAARQTLDGEAGWLGRALITQEWKLVLHDFPCDREAIRMPLPPLQAITGIKYIDTAGVERVLDPAAYRKREGEPGSVIPIGQWPSVRCQLDAVEVTFRCGYGDTGAKVPEPIRSAIALQVSQLRSLSARNLFLSTDTVEGIGTKQYVVGGNAGAAIDQAVTALLSTFRVFL